MLIKRQNKHEKMPCHLRNDPHSTTLKKKPAPTLTDGVVEDCNPQALIAQREGCCLCTYVDTKGHPTVGMNLEYFFLLSFLQ
jgi:hypothetical protein